MDMQLDVDQIRSVTWGAVRYIEEPDGITFNRFTQAQHDMYKQKNEGFL